MQSLKVEGDDGAYFGGDIKVLVVRYVLLVLGLIKL